tara:strand:+ start:942 stop:2297 length:1356 start_codon:yes stop_codon:yes gene_type:complete
MNNPTRLEVTIATALAALCCTGNAVSQTAYTIRRLPSAPGLTHGVAEAVNSAGQIVGYMFDTMGAWRAVSWTNDQLTLLPGNSPGTAVAINELGVICGSTTTATGSTAARWDPTPLGYAHVDLGLSPTAIFSGASGINANSRTCGSQVQGSGGLFATIWRDDSDVGAPFLLPALGPVFAVQAVAINNRDELVGYFSSGTAQPMLWSPATTSWQAKQLPTLTTSFSAGAAIDINDSGVAVGWSHDIQNTRHLVTWTNGVITDLGTLQGNPTTGYAINANGDIVGSSALAWPDYTAFVRIAGGSITELDSLLPAESPWHLKIGNDINDNGWIVGTGRRGNLDEPFVMIPTTVDLSAPQPGTAGAMNTFTASGNTPGQSVFFFVSMFGGETAISGCLEALDIANPLPFAVGNANANGTALVTVPVPAFLAGLPFLFQCYDPAACHTSDVVAFTF